MLYHVNDKDEVKPCRATKRPCKFTNFSEDNVPEAHIEKFESMKKKSAGINNETIGICLEVAFADGFKTEVSSKYRTRSKEEIVEKMLDPLKKMWEEKKLSPPLKHVAERGNPVDFVCEDGSTVSVKSLRWKDGKVAPQKSGQTTAESHFAVFKEFYDTVPEKLSDKISLFKTSVQKDPARYLSRYWSDTFATDYMLTGTNCMSDNPEYSIIDNSRLSAFDFDNDHITFTQGVDTWEESTTVKYDGISIGEFQIHKNRSNFKFRWHLKGLKAFIPKQAYL